MRIAHLEVRYKNPKMGWRLFHDWGGGRFSTRCWQIGPWLIWWLRPGVLEDFEEG